MNKPKFIAIAAVTVDGKIARHSKHLPFEWTSRADKAFLRRILNACDAAIMGNNTFKTIKRPNPKRKYVIFTRSIRGIAEKNGRIYFNSTASSLHRLAANYHWRNIAVLGGTQIYTWFLKKNLLDEFYLTVEPLLFGQGLPLFEGETPDRRLKLISMKKMNRQGTLLLHYKK